MSPVQLRLRLGLDEDATHAEVEDRWRQLHRTLGLQPGGEVIDVRRAWRRIIRVCHPDRNPDQPQSATDRFKAVTKASELLSDPELRAACLALLYPQRVVMTPGADLEARVALALVAALRGGPHTFDVDLGAHGTRRVVCDLPMGTEPGLNIRVRGEGAPGVPYGDLLLVVDSLEHPTWTLDGLDVHAPLVVSYAALYCGRQIDVETPWDTVAVRLPSALSTSADRRLRIRGHGVRRGKQRGAMVLTLTVAYPPTGDPALAAALRRLQP